MKKTYINPTIKVDEIQPEEFIAISTLGETESTSGNLGRDARFSGWDEEE